MAQKNICSKVSTAIGVDTEECKKLETAMVNVLLSCCCNLDAVAIPGFGTFTPEKNNERIVSDSNGKRFLLPPSVEIKWRASVMLRKNVVS